MSGDYECSGGEFILSSVPKVPWQPPWKMGDEVVIGKRNYGHVSSIVRAEGRVIQIGTTEHSGGRRITRGLLFAHDGTMRFVEPKR